MDFTEYTDMVELDEQNSTQCAVFDKTPGAEQKKINIVVRPKYTVKQVFADITTQFHYDNFDLVLQPQNADLIYLNDCPTTLLYSIPGFVPTVRNILILLPAGKWDGNVKQRFDVYLPSQLNLSVSCNDNSYAVNKSIGHNNNSNSITTSTLVNTNDNLCLDGGSNLSQNSMTTIANSINNSPTESFNYSVMSDQEQSDDDLALGASASPTSMEPAIGEISLTLAEPLSIVDQYECSVQIGCAGNTNDMDEQLSVTSNFDNKSNVFYSEKRFLSPTKYAADSSTNTSRTNGFVGLVNQAMTCYLNSLLQALFMTPEFRNALYRWEYDNDKETKNIPYQLQKLFLNLQTSQKSAVETTDLTRSFGWDSTEAWQQHDIQELCRVMFDALEQKFRNTQQANLIANLYEGKMIDYVKCLECNTEKTRADTFLDIPLPVRPFGSNVAYGSIEEALRAFVQPETLDGNNQYFCEKCNKKCDAHKGLKFKNFPYILTLHLKRFDFDYQTMHRIKLNDKVTFPANLNLNTFVNSAEKQQREENNAPPNVGSNGFVVNGNASTCVTNTDDCSTTDSGSAMEEDNCSIGVAAVANSNQQENDMNDDDEGIDMSTSTDHRISSSASIDQRLEQAPGPYLYELFAIMIHSGSASGGHYYAYIKQFETGEWYCFNDQLVTPITETEIEKSFGGCLSKVYYSSAFSSSTNAYMLMYRQVDAERNERPMKVEEFPPHIQSLLPNLQSAEEARPHRSGRSNVASDLTLPDLIKPRVYFYSPRFKKLMSARIFVSRSFDIKSALESAYTLLNVSEFAPMSRCRLVAFDATNEEIKQSFEHITDPTLAEYRSSLDSTPDFLLEYFAEGQDCEHYKSNGFTWYVYMVNLNTMEMDGPFFVHSAACENSDVLRHSIALRLHLCEKQMLLATLSGKKAFVAYDPIPTKEAQEHLQAVASARFQGLTYFYVNVPATDAVNLEFAGVPTYEPQPPPIQINTIGVDESAQKMNIINNEQTLNGCNKPAYVNTLRESPLPHNAAESNSEDSSLSDGDRTLVECNLKVDSGDSQISSNCHSPQLSSPEDESSNDSLNRLEAYFNGRSDYDSETRSNNYAVPQFFHAIRVDCAENESPRVIYQNADEDIINKPVFTYKFLVDSRMKMPVFKRHLELLIRVSANYFKLHRKHDSPDSLSTSSSLLFVSEGETLSIKLGKELEPDEHKAKIYYMRTSAFDNETPKLPVICEWVFKLNLTVAEAKKELVAKLHRLDELKYKNLTVSNCRLWSKGGSNPIKIYTDDDTFANEARSKLPVEIIVQECEKGIQSQVSDDSIIIFVRRWFPSKWELGPYQELAMDKEKEFRMELSKLSDIPEDDIAYAKINSSFPCNNISLLTVNNVTTNWTSSLATLDKYPLNTTNSGNVYLYKDNREEIKDLSTEEKRELTAKEKSRLDRLGVSGPPLLTPRRERALKIYLDSPKPQAANAATMKLSTCAEEWQ